MKRWSPILKQLLIINYSLLIIFSSCSVSHQISKSADKILLKDSVISTGHIGISIYEPATNSYWYNYDAAKYFVPASNVKLFTCYAGMKHLGDSLISAAYIDQGNELSIQFNGDPTFLDSEYSYQPLFNFLKKIKQNTNICRGNFKTSPLGQGWAWDDYNDSYMAERSDIPVYGNTFHFFFRNDSLISIPHVPNSYLIHSEEYLSSRETTDSIVNAYPYTKQYLNIPFVIKRDVDNNIFRINKASSYKEDFKIPIKTDWSSLNNFMLIIDTLKNPFINIYPSTYCSEFDKHFFNYDSFKRSVIHSQPTDSLLKPMMHRSDNFFAEQTLLMVSNEQLGYMNDEAIIDTLLKTDIKDVPQKPQWVDGCGLSRYNLFTPQSFVYILNKMKNDFGLGRLKVILPTGGEGTLKNYYLKDSGYIYAKTGSLSNSVSLSGFLITKKNKLLIFSILVNSFKNDSSPVRIAIEQFIGNIREKY